MFSRTLSTMLVVFTSVLNAQRPVAMPGFQHDGSAKEIDSLGWAGLYTQLPQYADWWRETLSCSRVKASLSRADSVQFYYVNAPDFSPVGKIDARKLVIGATYAQAEQIYLAVRQVAQPKTVKHEMLHQILYWAGVPDWESDRRPEFTLCDLNLS